MRSSHPDDNRVVDRGLVVVRGDGGEAPLRLVLLRHGFALSLTQGKGEVTPPMHRRRRDDHDLRVVQDGHVELPQRAQRVVVVMSGHLREAEAFVVLPRALTRRRNLHLVVQRAVQDVYLTVRPQQPQEAATRNRKVGKILDRARDTTASKARSGNGGCSISPSTKPRRPAGRPGRPGASSGRLVSSPQTRHPGRRARRAASQPLPQPRIEDSQRPGLNPK